MGIKQVAAHYLRAWSLNADGTYTLADNAPPAMRQFITRQPAATDRQIIHQALTTIATGQFPSVPDVAGLLTWFGRHTHAVARCDDALAAKKPPTNLADLLRTAYLAEFKAVRTAVERWLQDEIAQF